ncbi:MAG: OmpA family protein [Desulfovibrionaceae bacterium]|nr:OmpA family protein [Desulfovibrionaceae bacterium]
MSAKRKKSKSPPKDGWLVTFSDLMTLLLTFFVLLLSMSSLEVQKIMEISLKVKHKGGLGAARARIAHRVELVADVLRDVPETIEPIELLRDLFFPDDYLPDDFRQEFVKNVKIYKHQEGISIILSDNILFEAGKSTLTINATRALRALVEILQGLTTTYNISGHTDISGDPISNYLLSGERALTVLEYFLKNHVEEQRFSVSAYGSDRGLTYTKGEYNPAMERRIEILLRATPS